LAGPGIALRFGGRNWVGRLRIWRGFLPWSMRHAERVAEIKISRTQN
jgi:hypothetical protein